MARVTDFQSVNARSIRVIGSMRIPCKCEGECEKLPKLTECVARATAEDGYCDACRKNLKEISKITLT